MTTELATVENGTPPVLTEKDVREFIAPNATKKELFMFMNIAKSYGLNPFKREVHFVKYGNNPGQVIVGYEIYLKRAEATGKLNGWKAWVDGDKAKIIIWRKDWENPFEWEVDRKEFDKQQALWKSMPNFMLRKIAIAQAMRLCFPEDLGGMPYIPEEIGVDNNKPEEDVTTEPEPIPEPTSEPATTPRVEAKKLRKSLGDLILQHTNKDLSKAAEDLWAISDREYRSIKFIPDDKLEEMVLAAEQYYADKEQE